MQQQEDTASLSAEKQSSLGVNKDVGNKGHERQTSSSEQTSNSMISQHLGTLEHLDKQHQHLLGVEQSLQNHLDELQKEEQVLRQALVQSSTTLKEQRESEKQKKEAEALARLEDALMNDDDSDSDSSTS